MLPAAARISVVGTSGSLWKTPLHPVGETGSIAMQSCVVAADRMTFASWGHLLGNGSHLEHQPDRAVFPLWRLDSRPCTPFTLGTPLFRYVVESGGFGGSVLARTSMPCLKH